MALARILIPLVALASIATSASVAIGASMQAPSIEPSAQRAPAPPIPSLPAPPSLEPTVEAECSPEPPLAIASKPTPPAASLLRVMRDHPEELGTASIGFPTRGSLWNGVELKESDAIARAGNNPWGTELTVRSIERAVREVGRCHPGTPKLFVGDISRKPGGWLRPHRSHQSGLDADIGYYYKGSPAWFVGATAENLDVERTWALIRAINEGGNVEYVFLDHRVQRLLKPVAGADTSLFEVDTTKKDALIRHAAGHSTHFHVRFRDPAAAALGAKVAPLVPGVVLAARMRRR